MITKNTGRLMSDIKNQTNFNHIAIAWNIGAGKTSLSSKLAQFFKWDVHFESTDDNPYLSDFYHDMHRWSFNLQVYFLHSRYSQILDIQKGDKTVIQDRTIFEDANIFAPNLYEMGLMDGRDFENYLNLFKTMSQQVKAPDLLIYLRASTSTLVKHIQTRGRDYEGTMSIDYLKSLNERYEEWIKNYKEGNLLVIEVDNLDFVNSPEDLGYITNRVQRELHGLF
jgi:deoxyadenosine/deoxycytidine kinase